MEMVLVVNSKVIKEFHPRLSSNYPKVGGPELTCLQFSKLAFQNLIYEIMND